VFGNLVENAMKYGKAGGRVKVGARKQDAMIEFYVQDFGPGIAYEHLPRIFERASTAWIRRAPANPGAPGWGWPSPNTSSMPMAEIFAVRANLASAQPFSFACRALRWLAPQQSPPLEQVR
jgi:hypothetical protein